MKLTFQHVGRVLLLPFITMLLTSCANEGYLSLISGLERHDVVEITSPDMEGPDLELEDIELKMCLDEELVALSKTGIWNEPPSPVSVQPADNIIFDFPIIRNKQVEMYLHLFQNGQRKQFARWLSRSTTYLDMIEEELAEADLPLDLVYLAMIESGFNQLARSRSKAVGLWQFMHGTGKQYHLDIDKYVDERRDAQKSTKAAVSYLSDLYKEFNDWHLAVAAYNGGPGKIRYGLKKFKVDNFWELASKKYLSLETKRYVPKLIAALIIAKEPEKYGFTDIEYTKPLQYDSINVGPGVSLEAIAMISGSSIKEIKRLNHELRQNMTPANRAGYQVNIPVATAEIARNNFSRLHSIVSTGYKTHSIRKGDTLTKICKLYGVNKTTLLKVNNLRSNNLVSGQNLRIPFSTIKYKILPEGSTGAMAAYKDNLVLHMIKPGETLSRISNEYNVPVEMIVAWNGLKNSHSIRSGQQLALYIDSGSHVQVTQITDSSGKLAKNHIFTLSADRKKRHVSPAEEMFQWYNVQDGDSLWGISRKFSASTSDIKKWNNLKSNLIHPGSKLKLKKV